MLAIYAPLELYFTNKTDFWFDFPVLFPYCAGLFLAAFLFCLAVFFIASKIHQSLYRFALGCGLACLAAFYVQGNFLVAGLPALTGDTINWNAYPGQRVASILVWVIAFALVAAAYRFLGSKTMDTVSFAAGVFLLLMLLTTLVTVALSTDGLRRKGNQFSSTEHLWEFSSNKNFIILMLDTVDGAYFSRVLEEVPEYKEAFADFTYYDNALSGYGYTSLSVPHILTGEWFECQTSYEDYQVNALHDSPLFAALEKQDYQMSLYDDELMVDDVLNHDRFANMHSEQPTIRSTKAFRHCVMQMSGLKYAPFDLKRFCYDIYDRLESLKIRNDYFIDDVWFSWYNHPFYQGILNADPAVAGSESRAMITADNIFKWIHLEGSHTPFRAGAHMEYLGDAETAFDKARFRETVEGMAYLMRAYLDMLRSNGAYDNTAIIIMSDHGRGLEPGADGENHSITNQHPILMVKGFGEQHDLIINSAPISFDDLQPAFRKLIDGGEGGQLFDWNEGDRRARRFIDYEVGTFTPLTEYTQSGKAGDMSTFAPTGMVYALPENLLQ